jgi:glutathione S-transferase
MGLPLTIGNKNYSSWSLRPWLCSQGRGHSVRGDRHADLCSRQQRASDRGARAHARAIASEMHAGFQPLRRQCPMNMRRPVKKLELSAETTANVARIDAMWSDCRARFGAGGSFLFGGFTAADAMYAPVVSRFHTYAVAVGAASAAYMDAVMALPAWREWHAAAVVEEWVLAEDEVDWPTVLRA